jgi:hypothetical protein
MGTSILERKYDLFLCAFALMTMTLRLVYETRDCPLFFHWGLVEDPRGQDNIMCMMCGR